MVTFATALKSINALFFRVSKCSEFHVVYVGGTSRMTLMRPEKNHSGNKRSTFRFFKAKLDLLPRRFNLFITGKYDGFFIKSWALVVIGLFQLGLIN